MKLTLSEPAVAWLLTIIGFVHAQSLQFIEIQDGCQSWCFPRFLYQKKLALCVKVKRYSFDGDCEQIFFFENVFLS